MNPLEQAVRARDLVVIARVDHAGTAQKAGLALRPTQLLIFGTTGGFPEYRPLLVGDGPGRLAAERAGIAWLSWHDFLLSGPPSQA
jgi:hypothetical protein